MSKILTGYITVLAVVDGHGEMEYELDRAFMLIKSGGAKQVIEWRGSDAPLFYYNPNTGDVIYPTDVMYMYLMNGKLATQLDVVKEARRSGYLGKSVDEAITAVKNSGLSVRINSNPTPRFIFQ